MTIVKNMSGAIILIVDETNVVGFTRSYPGDGKTVLTVHLRKGLTQVCITSSEKVADAIAEAIYNILKDKT